MIFRLEYCNKASVTARVDIQKGGATPIYTVEGTAEPFILFYNNDKGDKSGSLRSSGADINIYETSGFNIDELKTSNETEISVKYYINNILKWSGFVIPDFFSETITGGKGVVSMVASDRLGTLKGATLSGLSAKVSNRALAEACLAQTGLSLPTYTMADFTGDGTNIFNSRVLSQRMVDTKGRNVSCYDILSSILEETNSLIVQRNGAWYIVNKLQLEAGSGSLYSASSTSSAWVENTVSFDEVSVGARRTIKPVAATVGVYHEHGGGRLHPNNYDFSLGVTGWTSVNGFVATTDNREIELYSNGTPIYGDATSNDYLVNNNERVSGELTLDTAPYLESASIPVVSTQSDMVDISVDVSITAPGGGSSSATPSFVRYAVIASNGTQTYALNRSGTFEIYDPTNLDHSQTIFIGSDVWGQIVAVSKSQLINGRLEADLTGFNVKVRIYGSGTYQTTAIHFASIRFSNTVELPKGNIFKTTQGANYTKDHEIPTVLWGDYLTSGLNGYFYDYPIDDTSSLYRPTGELHSGWTAYGDPNTLPLLQHITRQKSRMFSVAHDLLSADIKASTFDPLSIFVDCDNTRYVVVSARFDFLRSNVSVELEEVAYTTNSKRDYIYSYFGEGEEGISSIAGIAGGYTPSTGTTIPPIPDIRLSELRAYLDIIDSDVATLTGTYNQINESPVIDGPTKASLTTLFIEVTDAAGAYKTYALTALEDEVLTEEELAQLEILKQAYIDAVGAFKAVADPIITSLISVSLLKQNLQTYTSDKAQIDLVWSIISNNIYLVEPDKTTYDNAKSAYDTAYTAIVNKINDVIADGMATPAELAEVGTLTTAYLTALANYRSAEEVARKAIIDEQKRQTQEYAETQWQDVIDTQEALEQSLLNFSESINPITAQMMQLIVGDESLQYIFVESKVNPVRVSHSVSYDTVEKKLTVYAGWIKHLTLGITDISPDHTYKFWQLPLFTSDALTDPNKSYYLYAKCSDTVETGEFVLSETPIAIDAVSGYYHLLVGILNAENNLTRRFAPLYGFTEVLPGRITLDKIVSVDGQMVIDLINNTITSPTLKISSGGVDKDVEELLNKAGLNVYTNFDSFNYPADSTGALKGSLSDGVYQLTVKNGETLIPCGSTSTSPPSEGTYKVTSVTLPAGITVTKSLYGGQFRLTPSSLTVDTAVVAITIRVLLNGVYYTFNKVINYSKTSDGADGAPGADGSDGAPGADGSDGAPGADGFTVSASKDTHSYVTYPSGDIKGFLDAGLIKLSVINGSTVLTCSSTSTSAPTVNGTYRVTNAVVSTGLTITKNISGSQFVLYPATFTNDEGTVTLTIVARMNNTNHTFTKVVTYNKVSDGSDADMTEYEYLKNAIGQDAELTGALFTLVTILLKESMAADVTAGISGEQGASLDAPAFWSGGTYAQAISNVAKTILRHDGSGQLAGGNIEWDDAGNVELSGVSTGSNSRVKLSQGVLKIETDFLITPEDTMEAQSDVFTRGGASPLIYNGIRLKLALPDEMEIDQVSVNELYVDSNGFVKMKK